MDGADAVMGRLLVDTTLVAVEVDAGVVFAIGRYLDGVGVSMVQACGRASTTGNQGDPAISASLFVECSFGRLEQNLVVTPLTAALNSSVHSHGRFRKKW
jgi:hypothetical protein